MLRRTALEAQLSSILTKQKHFETKIRELGYQQNDSRVLKRVYDYLKGPFPQHGDEVKDG